MLLGSPRLRIIRNGNQLGGTENVERHIVGYGLQGGTRRHQLQHKNENHDGGKNSASGGNGERAQNVVEKYFRAVAHLAQTAGPTLGMLRLRRGYFNAYSQIRRGNIFRHARKQYGKLAKGFQLGAANRAAVQVLANLYALGGRRGPRESVV